MCSSSLDLGLHLGDLSFLDLGLHLGNVSFQMTPIIRPILPLYFLILVYKEAIDLGNYF